MVRKMLFAGFVLAVTFSLAAADEFGAVIRKVEGDKVTFTRFKKGEKGKGEETTLPAAANVRVTKGKFNKEAKKVEAGDELPEGLRNKRFQNIEKGVPAFIVTDADNKKITEIRVLQFGGKKKKDKN